MMKKLMGQDMDSMIFHQLLSQTKQTWPVVINLIPNMKYEQN